MVHRGSIVAQMLMALALPPRRSSRPLPSSTEEFLSGRLSAISIGERYFRGYNKLDPYVVW